MKKIKFWLEIDEAKGEYRQVELNSIDSNGVIIQFLDNENLGKKTKEIILNNVTTIFTPKYLKILGYEAIGNKNFTLKGYYLYTLKPYIKDNGNKTWAFKKFLNSDFATAEVETFKQLFGYK